MHHAIHFRPDAVDLAVDEALQHGLAPAGVQGIAVEVVFDQVLERGADRLEQGYLIPIGLVSIQDVGERHHGSAVADLATEDVDAAASALVFENTAWTAPDLPWLIPTELVPRAQAIAMRQADVRRELEHRMHAVHKQLRLVRQLDQGAQLSTPAYVDMQA